ncbi:fungal-specific transcription factor domain-containing protein [Mycena belliarum]|uniref:Fungal-specific transcription factor domain-containing protein n=1 Tax=Mycena belliarum TaxID=1033014 RepID=A0AAD6UIV5_9AGAR|nr:fungal-specific transcription factor domain-containing protein [Mycena belliae]
MESAPASPTHPNPPPSSLQSALQMDARPPDNEGAEGQGPPRKRKKHGADEGSPSEPRRLRRSHEACTRCRAKKIKCDSKHPRCTSCATAGVVCAQEDRHRNTLTPRGHVEHVELQLGQCLLLLKRHYPNFELENLEAILAREGINDQPPAIQAFTYPGSSYHAPLAAGAPPPVATYPPNYPTVYNAQSYPRPPPTGYNPHIHPAFQQAAYPPPGPTAVPGPAPRPVTTDIKGQDPNSNDLSNTQSLAKNFGVSPDIVSVIASNNVDKEDLAVGSSGLTSGRDRTIHEATVPRDPAHWVTVTVRRGSNAAAHPPHISTVIPELPGALDVWLPKDRKMVTAIVDVYFTRLNIHRPVFSRRDFDRALDDLYAGQIPAAAEANPQHDPGFLCSFYLVLALGTLSDLNNRSVHHPIDDSATQELLVKKLMPPDWPEHDEFFERALSVKPDLRVTISSLQALILLHWYLYTERQGRTLWRLVGSLVRLSIELGLHHDPTTQINPTTKQRIFTEEECILRVKLWGIILIHDRGTSILLGRPLGIAPSDSNTPRPSRPKSNRHDDFSEHFELSHAVAEIQADIINSLYSPTRQKGDSIMRNATRVIKSMSEFRRSLPKEYQFYFGGTDDWTVESKTKLVQEINEDEGLTLLKVGIARLLLLRALFSSSELSYEHRHKALIDAIVTAHNVIIFHSQLIRFPDIAFFTSPIPLHIAAMVILYGHMSNCERLPRQTAIEDMWLALDMLPRFRWRWERKDLNGGHPLIFELASHVMGVDLHTVKPATHPVLLSEPEWDEDSAMPSPMPLSAQQTSPSPANAYPSSKTPYGPHPRGMNGGAPLHVSTGVGSNAAGGKHLVEIPTGLFYPFYPDENGNLPVAAPGANGAQEQGYGHILAAAATHGQHGSYGGQGSHDTFISEERNPMHRMQWVNNNMHQRPYPVSPPA